MKRENFYTVRISNFHAVAAQGVKDRSGRKKRKKREKKKGAGHFERGISDSRGEKLKAGPNGHGRKTTGRWFVRFPPLT